MMMMESGEGSSSSSHGSHVHGPSSSSHGRHHQGHGGMILHGHHGHSGGSGQQQQQGQVGQGGQGQHHHHHQQQSDSSGSISGGNVALMELDVGLRSCNLGLQSESIVRFPALFKCYPFPILINSGSLKLVDIYRTYPNNFIKLNILRVFEESTKFLPQISHFTELVKRISGVFHSNDPIARSLTLRLLATLGPLIPERKHIHQSIRNALDSNDQVELQAAIYAAGQFAAQSKNFSVNMCEKISAMIRGYDTPLNIKLELIPIFQHMYHDMQTARVVRKTCAEMLPSYPVSQFVLVTLKTLTRLSARTCVDLPEQVQLLLKYLYQDPRRRIQKAVLEDLQFLASEDRGHLWETSNVESVIQFALNLLDSRENNEEDDSVLVVGALTVLCRLLALNSSSLLIEKFNLNDQEPHSVLNLIRKCCYRNNLAVSAESTQLMTLICINYEKEPTVKEETSKYGIDIYTETIMAIESLFLLLSSDIITRPNSSSVLKECLRCIVMLCNGYPVACEQFVDIVNLSGQSSNESNMILLCQVLAAIGNRRKGVLKLLLPEICDLLSTSSSIKVLKILSTLLLQTMKGHSWDSVQRESFDTALRNVDNWTKYQIARSATRYGHPDKAESIFNHLSDSVSSEHHYFWLLGLAQISEAEKILSNRSNNDIVYRIKEANSKILEGLTSITASATPNHQQKFQINYLKCRSDFLLALVQLVYACNSIRTCPPPAIAKLSHDELTRCGRITVLLRQSVKEFENVGNSYAKLYETSFDADPETLLQLRLIQTINLNLSSWIEIVCLKSSLQGSIYNETDIEFSVSNLDKIDECGLEIFELIKTGEKMADLFSNLSSNPDIIPIDNNHTKCLISIVKLLISNPLSLPRLFYQSRQSSGLKIAVTPTPRNNNDPINVNSSQNLAIKVEGVLTNQLTKKKNNNESSSPFAWRSVKSVKLTLTSHLQTPSKSVLESGMKIPDCNMSMDQIVQPQNDFFTAQFLLPFPVAGLHQIIIETYVIDKDDNIWVNDEKKNLTVKSFDDGRQANNRNR